MNRRYSFPTGHWNWPVNLTHQHAVRAGNLVFTGGQVDLDANGVVRNKGDLDAQCRNSMAYMAVLFDDLSVEFADLVRLVVYYVGDKIDEARLLGLLAEIIGSDARPAINFINMPELCYPDMRIEIEGVAMRAPDGRKVAKQYFRLDDLPPLPPAFSHAVRAGDMVFMSDISALSAQGDAMMPNDIAGQTTVMMERLCKLLLAVGSDFSDVVKVSTFYCGGGTARDWELSAKIRAEYFPNPGPSATGIPLPSFPYAGLMTKIAATAICSDANDHTSSKRRFVWPDGHWDWSAPLPYKHGNICDNVIHIGGQVSLDSSANVIHPGDMVAQTKVAMENLAKVLAGFDATLDDIVKITTFYQGNASAEALHENLVIRSNSYTCPGPATTGIPVPALAYENMVIEIEAIAVVD